MNTRLEQQAADSLEAYERQQRHRQGYRAKPADPMGETWRPTFTEQQQREHEQYIKINNLPF